MTTQKITISVDITKMTFGDLEVLDRATAGSFVEFNNMLERVATIKGVESIRELPLSELNAVVQAISDAVGEAGDAGNSNGGS